MKRQARVKIKHELSDESHINFLVPQGSVLGPILFNLYVSTLFYEIRDLPLLLSGYADDHGAHISFNANSREEGDYSSQMLEPFLSITKQWMDENHLNINISKTEYIKFGNPRQLGKFIFNSIDFEDLQIKQADSVENLGVEMDKYLNYQKHIVSKCNKVQWNLSKIINPKPHLSVKKAAQLVLSLVISHIDCSNGFLTRLPYKPYKILQHMQNMSAKVILNKSYRDSSTECVNHSSQMPVWNGTELLEEKIQFYTV